MVADVTGLLPVEQLFDGLPIEYPVNFEQRIAVDVFAHHDLGLLAEDAVHKKHLWIL